MRLVEGNEGGVQIRLAEKLHLAVGLDVAATDGPVEGDRVGPLLGRAVAQPAPLAVGVVGARYCECVVTIGWGVRMAERRVRGRPWLRLGRPGGGRRPSVWNGVAGG